jgi:hypothetical protein
VMAECRERADWAMREGKPTNWKAAAAIFTVWVLLALVVIVLLLRTVWGQGWFA